MEPSGTFFSEFSSVPAGQAEDTVEQTAVVRAADIDRVESEKIKHILREDYDQYEPEAEQNKKKRILGKLQKIVIDWIQQCGRDLDKDDETILSSGGKIFTFGSYRKGVNGPGSDIDTLVVAPRHIDRDKHFFGVLPTILRKTPGVKELTEVKEAQVPVIKMKFEEVDIDMLFARVQLKEVGNDLELLDDNILRNCDPETIRSLNGCRVTEQTLAIVKENLDEF